MSQDREEELEYDPGLGLNDEQDGAGGDDDGLDPLDFLGLLDQDVDQAEEGNNVNRTGDIRNRSNSRSDSHRSDTPIPRSHNQSPIVPTTRINRTMHTSRRPTITNNNPIDITSSGSSRSSAASPPPPHRPIPLSSQESSDSIVALEEDEISEIGRRRFTAAEKGKGRAVVAAADEPEVVVLRGKKRKSGEIEKRGKGTNAEEALEIDELFGEDDDYNATRVGIEDKVEEEIEEAEEGVEYMDEFTCPVCFCNLTRPVSTLCGHILCGDCLHSSLLSAIGRNPNPLPTGAGGDPRHHHHHHHHHAGPAPRPRTPRVTYSKAKSKSDPIHNPSPDSVDAQPPEWTFATLTAKLASEREEEKVEWEKLSEKQFKEAGLPEENWEAAKIGMGMREDLVLSGDEVKEVLKGVWRIPGGVVIEGECPVCRNPIPGGMGPYGSGIGSITPITAMLV